MKFYINQIIVWFGDGAFRELSLLPNKLNLLVKDERFEKKYLPEIIRFCFLQPPKFFPKKEAGQEKIICCGLQFVINDKLYCIARYIQGKNHKKGFYYFSDSGVVPMAHPTLNISEEKLKSILEKEFSIEQDLIFNFEGRFIQKNTQLALQHFFAFNFIAEKDFQNQRLFSPKNKSSLEQLKTVFEISSGISGFKNVEIQNRIQHLETQKNMLKKKQELFEKEKSIFQTELIHWIQKAKAFGWIPEGVQDVAEGIRHIESLFENSLPKANEVPFSAPEQLLEEKSKLIRLIHQLRNGFQEYSQYKKNIRKSQADIKLINELASLLPKSNSIDKILKNTEAEWKKIREELSDKYHLPFQSSNLKEIQEAEKRIQEIDAMLSLEATAHDPSSIAEKYIFLGEIKARLDLYQKEWNREKHTLELKFLDNQIRDLQNQQDSYKLNKTQVKDRFTELLRKYLENLGEADKKNTIEFNPDLLEVSQVISEGESQNKENQALPKSKIVLSFYLSLHEFFIKQKNPFNPSFLLIENLLGQGLEGFTECLSAYIDHLNLVLEQDFQIILLESKEVDEIWQFE